MTAGSPTGVAAIGDACVVERRPHNFDECRAHRDPLLAGFGADDRGLHLRPFDELARIGVGARMRVEATRVMARRARLEQVGSVRAASLATRRTEMKRRGIVAEPNGAHAKSGRTRAARTEEPQLLRRNARDRA